jgi:HD-GYP domain-containing protein (c-di-GMP phosphodiesterase class II)
MKKIKTKDLKEGMRFTKPIYIDENTVLLQAELPLKQKEIDRLDKWNVEEVLTEGKLVVDDGSQLDAGTQTLEVAQDYTLSFTDTKGLKLYTSAVDQLGGVFEEVKKGQKIEHDRIDSIVQDIITTVEEDEKSIVQLILLGGETQKTLSDNSVKSAILSTIIGKNMKMLSFRLLQLATGALLHDIGMLKIPEGIQAKKGKLTPEELKQVRSHPVLGYTVVIKELRYPEEVAAIALLHQERWDGTGYPRRLKGDDIPLGARIVAVADAFVAMVNKRAYRDQMIGYKAMKAILSDNGRHFDPKVLKALLASMGIYPVGSLVQLNNGSIGRVIETHSMAPLRPKVQLIIDEYGDKLVGEIVVDLLSQKDLFIAKALDPKTLARMSSE